MSDFFWWEKQENVWADFELTPVMGSDLDGERVVVQSSKGESANHACSWPLTNMTVCVNGNVLICCQDWKMDTVIGNIKKESLFDIWNGETIHKKRIALLENNRLAASESCHTCRLISFDNIDNDAQEILQKLQGTRSKK